MHKADIQETAQRNGTFIATLRPGERHRYRAEGISVTSRDPEYDLAHAMTKAGYADGPIQFYRNAVPSISFRSIHRAAGWRIELGHYCPYRLVKRNEGRPEIFKNPVAGVTQTDESQEG